MKTAALVKDKKAELVTADTEFKSARRKSESTG